MQFDPNKVQNKQLSDPQLNGHEDIEEIVDPTDQIAKNKILEEFNTGSPMKAGAAHTGKIVFKPSTKKKVQLTFD